MGNGQSLSVGCAPVRLGDPGKELLKSAENGDADLVGHILSGDSTYLSHSSVFGGNSAWHKAAKAGRVEVFEAMRRVVASQFGECKDVAEATRSCVGRLGSTPAEVVKRLVNKANLKGITPLMLACSGGYTDAVAWLVEHGADVWRHDRIRRHTALHCAAQVGATDAIRLLLAAAGSERHPSSNKTLLEMGNHAGLTALHYAVYCDQLEVVQQLLAQEADITAQAEFPDLDWGSVNAGDTALHIAAHKGNIDTIQLLLRAYNEVSGALMPQDGSAPRRTRDPRAMRNDYGRLPYHLAMRRNFPWLAEMLDPSVPVRYLLAGEQLGTDTTWGPPRLATIAAAVLHQSLVADLKAIKAQAAAAGVPERGAADDAGADAAAAAAALSVVQPPADSEGGGWRRRWSLSSRRSSSSGGGRRRSGNGSRRESSSGGGTAGADGADGGGGGSAASSRPNSRAAAAVADLASLMRPPSRRQAGFGAAAAAAAGAAVAAASSAVTASRGHSRRGSRGAGEFGAPGAPSPLSPRMLMAAVLGSAGVAPGAAAAAAAAASAAADAGAELQALPEQPPGAASAPASPGSPPLSPKAHGLAELVLLQGPGSGGKGTKGSRAAAEEADGQPGQQQQQPQQHHHCGPSRCASGSYCSVLDLEITSWAESSAQGIEGAGASSAAAGSAGGGCACDCGGSGKVSPLPGGSAPQQADCGASQYLRWAGASCSPSIAEGDADNGGSAGCSSDYGEDGGTCGVCLDAPPTARIAPCSHSMCADCALDMCERFSLSAAVCPFCRCIIRGFAPALGPAATSAPPALAALEP